MSDAFPVTNPAIESNVQHALWHGSVVRATAGWTILSKVSIRRTARATDLSSDPIPPRYA